MSLGKSVRMLSVNALDKMVAGACVRGQRLLQSTFVRDVLLLSGGTGIAQAIGLAILPVISRIYSPEDFGLLALFASIVTLLAVFTTFKYELMIMQSRSHRSASQLVCLIMAIGICAASVSLVIVVLFRHQIANLLGTPQLEAWLWMLPVLLLFTGLYQALRFWKIRLGQFSIVAHSTIARALVFAAVATAMSFIPLGTMAKGGGLIIAFILSEIAMTLTLLLSVRSQDMKLFAPANWKRIKIVGSQNGPVAAALSVSWAMAAVYERIPDLMISSFFGTVSLGFYSMVGRIVAAPSRLVSAAINDVYRQRASELHRKQGRFDALTLTTLSTTAAMSVVPFVVAIIYAPTLFSILLGPEWELAGHYASILLVGEFLAFTITSSDSAAVIVKDKRLIFFWGLARLLFTLGLYPFLHLGILDFVGFLWALVGIRILMLSLAGVANFLCAKTGHPLRWPAPRSVTSL